MYKFKVWRFTVGCWLWRAVFCAILWGRRADGRRHPVQPYATATQKALLEDRLPRHGEGGWEATLLQHPATPQSPSVTPLTRPDPSVAARHLPTLWGVTPQGEPSSRRGEHCSPGQSRVIAKLRGRTLCAPTTQFPVVFGPGGARRRTVQKR